MYALPEMYNVNDCLCPVPLEEIIICESECTPKNGYPCEQNLFELCCIIMDELHLEAPTNSEEAVNLYLVLRAEVHSLL